MTLIILLVVAVTVLVLHLRHVYSKLSRAGVNHIPIVPLFGNLYKNVTKQVHFTEIIMKSCLEFPDDRIVGMYEIMNPVLLIKDLELIKKIAVKDFDHFVDRKTFANENDPLFGRSLLLLKGEEWKSMRATLSPAFTSSKIRLMVPFMVEVGDEMIKYLKKRILESGHSYIDVEGKDLATRYANDVIASCAFGLKVVSHAKDNMFYRMSKSIFVINYRTLVKMIMSRCLPNVARVLWITMSNPDTEKFFTSLVLSTMKNREQQNIIRNDMIHLLMEAKKGRLSYEAKESKESDTGFATVEESIIGRKQNNTEWTDKDIVAQVVLFQLAGYETISTQMSFMLHELAANPDVQERLYQEIRENSKNNGNFDYNSIKNMVYMDMVVSGEYVNFPIWLFHRSPENFPNPTKFDPERFSEQNKHKIKPFTYMPFGLGPRNCIASRFALCEVKVMLYQTLQHFQVLPCERTVVPAQLDTSVITLNIKGGAWIRFKIRQE